MIVFFSSGVALINPLDLLQDERDALIFVAMKGVTGNETPAHGDEVTAAMAAHKTEALQRALEAESLHQSKKVVRCSTLGASQAQLSPFFNAVWHHACLPLFLLLPVQGHAAAHHRDGLGAGILVVLVVWVGVRQLELGG